MAARAIRRSPQARTEARWGAIFAAPALLLILVILLAPLAVLAASTVLARVINWSGRR